MKFAFCVFKYFPFGGLERNCLRMAQTARLRGHEVDIYCYHWHGEKPTGVNVVEVSVRGLTNHGRAASFVKKVLPVIQQKKYDIVVGFNRMPGLDLFYAADVCYEHSVQTQHGWGYRCLPRYKIYSAFERAVFLPESHTEILSIVDCEKAWAQNYYGTPAARFHDIPPGIHKDRMAPDDADENKKQLREKFKVADDQHVMLFIGSDFKRKGLDRALLALAALPKNIKEKVIFWIVGQCDKRSYLALAKKIGVAQNCQFLGARHDVPDLLQAADVLIHPARLEATGGVLLEAVVAGLPVLATEICGFAPHIERAKAGIIVKSHPFEQTDLDEALCHAFSSDKIKAWRKNAINYGRTTDLYSRAERAVDVMEKIVERKKSKIVDMEKS